MLLSTLSFTVDMHYCGDMLVNAAIFHNAESCGMDMEGTVSHHSDIKNKCCSKKQIHVQGQDELNIYFDKLSIQQQQFVAFFVVAYVNIFDGLEKNIASFEAYKPPLVMRQIYKLNETYLI